jgi:hypothetical protein
MKRPGVISWGLLFGQADKLKQYLLLYDELWVPDLKGSYPDDKTIEEWDLDREHLASIAYLAHEGLIKEPPIDVNSEATRRDKVTAALVKMYNAADAAGSKVYRTPDKAAREAAAASFNMDIALSRLLTYVLWRDREEVAYPVFFPFGTAERFPKELAETHNALSIVIEKLPTPSPDLPFEDIVAFKRDSETQYKFAKFWHWTKKIAKGTSNRNELREEIDWLLLDYSTHLKQLTKEINSERAEVVVATPVEVLEDLVKFRWGKIVRGLFALRQKQISAHSAELKLPGSELAYITEASRVLSRRRNRIEGE